MAQGDGPCLSSRPWNNEYDGFAKLFFVQKKSSWFYTQLTTKSREV